MIDLEVMGNALQAIQISNNKKARYSYITGFWLFDILSVKLNYLRLALPMLIDRAGFSYSLYA